MDADLGISKWAIAALVASVVCLALSPTLRRWEHEKT